MLFQTHDPFKSAVNKPHYRITLKPPFIYVKRSKLMQLLCNSGLLRSTPPYSYHYINLHNHKAIRARILQHYDAE